MAAAGRRFRSYCRRQLSATQLCGVSRRGSKIDDSEEKQRETQRELESKQKKEDNGGIHGNPDRIADLVFGENNENVSERGIIDECDFHRDVIEHENKEK